MEKKSVSATILILFLSLFFSVVGSCFSFFVYKYSRTLVEKIGIVADASIGVFSDEKLSRKINELKLSDMELGLKPATGEVDKESQVPSTIVDDGTSEDQNAFQNFLDCRYSDVSKPLKITFLIWLGSLASDELEGAKISFDINFVAI